MHKYLKNQLPWYRQWHESWIHGPSHWLVFACTVLTATSLFSYILHSAPGDTIVENLVPSVHAQTSGISYYVDNKTGSNCSNTGPGTFYQPFCNIATANTRHAGGDTVYIKPGEYREEIRPKQGTSGQYSKYIGYGSREQVILQGSDVVIGNWASEGNGIYSVGFVGIQSAAMGMSGMGCYPENINCFEDADRPLKPVSTLAGISAPGMNYYDVATSKLYVRSYTGTPSEHKIACNVRLNFLDSMSYMSIQNLSMLHSCRDGVTLGTGIHDVEIKNTEIAFMSASCSNNGGGIFKGNDNDSTYNPNFQIIGNRVHNVGCWQGSGYDYAAGGFGIQFYDIGDSLIANNEVFNAGIGVYLKSFTNNVIVRNNRIHAAPTGVMLLTGASNNLIEDNVIYNTISNFGGESAGIFAISNLQNITIRGNTILNASVGISLGNYARLPVGQGFTIANNIIKDIPSRSVQEGPYYESNNFVLWSSSASTTSSNHNLFHNSPQHFATTTTSLKTGVVAYNTLAQWQATGKDLNSRNTDPLFMSIDPSNQNFLRPSSESPAIDAGEFIPGYHCPRSDNNPTNPYPASDTTCRHWSGNAPDIGVYEYGVTVLDTTPPAAVTNLQAL